jgi:phasin family protein
MSVFTEQLVPLQQGNVITLFALTNQAFQGLQKVAALNLQAVRSALAEGEVNWKEALSGQPPEAIVTRQINTAQLTAEKMLSYNRHLYEIASGTHAELLKVWQARHEQQNRDAQTLVDRLATSAPAGAEAAITVLKSAFPTASLAYETVRKAATQAIEVTQSNFAAMSAAASAAASKAGQQAPAQMSRAAKQ